MKSSDPTKKSSATNESSIIIVPDLWIDRSPWFLMAAQLDLMGYPTTVVDLPSTSEDGTSTNKSMVDDIAKIRLTVAELVDQGKDVTLVCHGTGGFLGCNAIEGLTTASRTKANLKGSVSRIVFVAAQLYEEGETPNVHYLAEPNVVDEDGNPTGVPRRENWIKPVTFCAWKEVPSVYAVLTQDEVTPMDVQQKWVKLTESWSVPIASKHLPELDDVAAFGVLIIRFCETPCDTDEEFKEDYARSLAEEKEEEMKLATVSDDTSIND